MGSSNSTGPRPVGKCDTQIHTVWDFMMGLGISMMCTKFEVASLSHCVNVELEEETNSNIRLVTQLLCVALQSFVVFSGHLWSFPVPCGPLAPCGPFSDQ